MVQVGTVSVKCPFHFVSMCLRCWGVIVTVGHSQGQKNLKDTGEECTVTMSLFALVT